jgi:hypothetical protein
VSLHFLKKEKRLTLKYSEIFEELFIFSSFRGFWQQVPDFEKMEIKRKPKNFTQLTSADSWDHDAAPCAPEVICRLGNAELALVPVADAALMKTLQTFLPEQYAANKGQRC